MARVEVLTRGEIRAPIRAPIDTPERGPIEAIWLGRRPYRDVWALQKQLADFGLIDACGDRKSVV